MIHGDVFRNPDHLNLFVAFIGSGAQIFCTIFILLLSVVLGVFKATRRGALLTAAILIYALCGLFGGLIGGRLFRQLKGVNWAWNTMLTASIFPVPLAIVFTFVNSVAWNSNSTAALPFTTIAVSTPCVLLLFSPLCALVLTPYVSSLYTASSSSRRSSCSHTSP
jgi:transmembrane 9 superfamily protein 2/4